MRPLSLEELFQKAEKIAVGRVVDLSCQMDPRTELIYTWVTLHVEKEFKSGRGDFELRLRIPGGRIGNLALKVSHAPRFSKGERVLVFLRQVGNDWTVVGWQQGKFTLQGQRIRGQKITLPELEARILRVTQREGMPRSDTGLKVHPARIELSGFQAAQTTPLDKGFHLQAPTGWQVVIQEDFEGEFPGDRWQVVDADGATNGEYYWGKTDVLAAQGQYSAWCAAAGQNALDPQVSNYPNNLQTWMVHGPFDLSDASDGKLSFQIWFKVYSSEDWFFWGASTDGRYFQGYKTTGTSSGGWINVSYNLADPGFPDIIGQSEVWIAFIFYSDASGTDKGVFLDSIVVEKYVPTVSPPEILQVEPDTVPAGTGAVITLTGQYFGSPSDSSFVLFYHPTDTLKVDILSWTDTEIRCRMPEGASSGPVYVVTPKGGRSNGYPIYVPFGYTGLRWAGEHPMAETFEVYDNPPEPLAGVLETIQRAAGTWSTVAGSRFRFTYGGPTTREAPVFDGHNVIRWNPSIENSEAVAVTYIWYDPNSKVIQECDLVFNGQYKWSTSATPPSDRYDLESITVHEMGHFLHLTDLYGHADRDKTMYGYGQPGEFKSRTLHEDDVKGILYIYGVPTLTLGVLQHPVFTENLDVYLVGDDYLESASVQGQMTTAAESQPLRFAALDTQGQVYVDDGVILTQAGTVRFTASARRKDRFITGVDTLILDISLIPYRTGGLLASHTGTAQLYIFPQSFGGDVYLTLWHRSGDRLSLGLPQAPVQVSNGRGGSRVVVLGPQDLRLRKPANLTMVYHPEEFAGLDQKKLVIARWTPEGWQSLGGVVDTYRHTVSTQIQKLGWFRILYDLEKQTDVNPLLPNRLELIPVYPNPFFADRLDSRLTVGFRLPHRSPVQIAVYNILGRRVKVLLEDIEEPGYHESYWDGRDERGYQVPAGVYLCRLQMGNKIARQKFVIVH